MMRAAVPWLSVFFALIGFHASSAGERPVRSMSLREALDLAQTRSYQILLSESQSREAGGQNLEAWRAYLPQVVVSERAIRSDDPVTVFGAKLRQGVFAQDDFDLRALNVPGEINNFATAIEVRQPLVNPDAMFGKSAAGLAAKASAYRLARTKEAVALEVEKAYYGLVLSHTNLSTIEDAVASAETHLREAQAAYSKGLVSEADFLASQVRLAEVEEQRLTARLNIANAEDHLSFLLGMEEAQIIPTDSLVITPSDLDLPGVSLDAAPEQRSDLMALRYQDEAARKSAWMRRSEWLPRLNAFGSTEWNDDDLFGTGRNHWTAGIMLEWNLFDGLGTWGRGVQAAARAAAARTQLREAQARSGMEVRRAYRSLLTAKERVGVAEKAVNQSGESLRIVEARFKQGLERVSDLLDRESAHTNAELRLQNATYDFKVARSELGFYLGTGSPSLNR